MVELFLLGIFFITIVWYLEKKQNNRSDNDE